MMQTAEKVQDALAVAAYEGYKSELEAIFQYELEANDITYQLLTAEDTLIEIARTVDLTEAITQAKRASC